MKAEGFIIHLQRAQARRLQVDRLKETLPVAAHVIDAVDGAAMSEAEIAAVYRPSMHRPRYPFALRTSEVACFLSHRKAWQTIVDGGLDAGLIVEDDVELDARLFPRVFDLALGHMNSGDYVRFPEKLRVEGRHVIAEDGEAKLALASRPGLGMQAQLVGRDAARALLDFTGRFDRPVDTTIQMCWRHEARLLAVWPGAICEIDEKLGGTTIQGKSKRLAETLLREVQRARYRLAVRAYTTLAFW